MLNPMATLGRYEILQEIGRGGEGVVYLAVDPTIDRKVAIKTLPISHDPTGAMRAKLRQEAKSTARLNHPNIVTVFEFAQEEDLAYIVMEYVAGQTLAAALETGESFDYQTIYRYLMQAAEALDHAHSEGVIHRDIKPENLMIQTRGGLKVADFGIAKVLDDVGNAKTKTGVVRGTPYYLSPEQIDARGITGKTDQFALGVVTYEWLTGTRPFEGDSWTELLTKILTQTPPPVSQYRETLGEPVTQAILKAMAKDPANRFDNCCEYVRELGHALGVVTSERIPVITHTAQQLPIAAVTAKAKTTTGSAAPAPAVAASTTAQQAAPVANRSRWTLVGIGATGLIALAAVLLTREKPASTPVQAPPTVTQTPAQTSPTNVEPTLPTVAPKAESKQRETAGKAVPPAQNAAVKSAPTKELPSKKAESAPVTAAQQTPPPAPQPAASQQVATPPVEAPPAAPPVAAGKYFGPPEGRFSWSGALASGQSLTITASSASSGSILGRGLPPSLDVSVSVDPPTVQLLAQPNPSNGYRLTLKNSSPADIQSIVIRWREHKK
jgi:predicted Ser/Thr protein kinase